MKQLSEYASNVLTALVLGAVMVFGLYQALTPAMMETAMMWVRWFLRDVLYWLFILSIVIGGMIIFWLAARTGISDMLSSYHVTLIDEEQA